MGLYLNGVALGTDHDVLIGAPPDEFGQHSPSEPSAIIVAGRQVYPLPRNECVAVGDIVCDDFVDDLLVPLPLHTPVYDQVGGGWIRPSGVHPMLIWYGSYFRPSRYQAKTRGHGAYSPVSGDNAHLIEITGAPSGIYDYLVVEGTFTGNFLHQAVVLQGQIIFAGIVSPAAWASVKVGPEGIWFGQSASPVFDVLVKSVEWVEHDGYQIQVYRNKAATTYNVRVRLLMGDTVVQTVEVEDITYAPLAGSVSFDFPGFATMGKGFPICDRFAVYDVGVF